MFRSVLVSSVLVIGSVKTTLKIGLLGIARALLNNVIKQTPTNPKDTIFWLTGHEWTALEAIAKFITASNEHDNSNKKWKI